MLLTLTVAAEVELDEGDLGLALSGLQAIAVSVSEVDPHYQRFGLRPEQIKEMVEARLRSIGIEVVSQARARSDNRAAMLAVSCRLVDGALNYYSYAVGLKLKQKIPLPHSGTAFTTGTIWSDGQVGAIREIEMNRLSGYIAEVLERFVDDYKSQNG